MATLPESAQDNYRTLLAAQSRAVRAGRRAWKQVSTDYISQSWTEQVGTLLQTVTTQQTVAAASSILSASMTIAEQGSWSAPSAFADPSAFSGFAADGRDLDGLLYSPATRAKKLIGGGMSVSNAMDRAGSWLSTLLTTTVADAARQAQGVTTATRAGTGYVRMTTPPSCKDCIILAGKFFRWNTGFQRHPGCDCVHVPTQVTSTAEAYANGLMDDPYELFGRLSDEEQEKLFGAANARAIRDGADIFQVVNSKRGLSSTGLFTTEGTTRRGNAARLLQPGQRRATPELIYRWAGNDHTEALRLLQQHGYVLQGGQNPAGTLLGRVEGLGQMGHGGTRRNATEAVLMSRLTGQRTGSVYTMTAAERRLYDAERVWQEVLAGRNPWSSAAVERYGGSKIRSAGSALTPQISALVEQRYRAAVMSKGEAVSMRAALRQLRKG